MRGRMGGETEKELLKLLETALARERAAEDLYRIGAELTQRPEVKAMFIQLAGEEHRHEELLRQEYHAIKKRLGLKVLHDEP